MSFGKSDSPKKDLKPPANKGGVSSDVEKAQAPHEMEAVPEESLSQVSSSEEESSAEDEVRGEATIEEVAARLVEPEAVKPEGAQEKIKKLTEENAHLFDQLLRKQAEFENFRKRTEKEKAEFMRYANFEIVRSLLPVLDGFERALHMETSEELEGFKKGMELVYKQFSDGLQKAGLKPILALGHKFDPNFHQAMVHEERDDLEENMVIEEYQRGYTFQGRLLRAAMVKVAMVKKPSSGKEEGADSETP
ncbi:MAG: nucleotide exchange factor GrpE [Acidobacteriia bacterium]|nr:nucleotide exchange factor GrpE [Terriglobia bacterium]